MMSFIRWAVILCIPLCVAGPAFSQSTNSGDIRGTVTDSSGAVVPGVTVTVLNLDTAATKDLVTNSDGLYDTASILPGNYRVTFTKRVSENCARPDHVASRECHSKRCVEGG